MRKQYYFASGKVGIDAWDVDRLIELTRELANFELALSAIGEIDSVYWFEYEGNRPTVRAIAQHAQLISTVDPSFPIILGANGQVMDGMHRVARALLEGRSTIRAVRFAVQPEPDYRDCDPTDLPY